MQLFTDEIARAVADAAGLEAGDVRIETPRDRKLGDFAFPCFQLAKTLRKAPPAIAAELAPRLQAALEGITAVPTGPYLNFRVDRARLAREVLRAVRAAGDAWGSSREGAGKTVVVDLSSPNIAKPMSVGHLRSTVIGAALQRIFDALGYRTVGINHIGDWGSQFGKLVAAIDRWGDTVDLEDEPIRALLSLYVRYHEEEERDPTLAEEAQRAFQELESGKDGHVRRTWKRLTELSLREFDRIYARLNVQFDEVRGESYYESHLQSTIERVREAGVTAESEGALIVDLTPVEPNMPPCLLRKTDGTTLYATRDLAAVFHRWELYRFDRCLYVVGGEQRLHFQQLKGVLQRMGVEWEPRVEHVAFGLMRLPEGKLSTRKGRVVFLDDVLDAAVLEAQRVVAEKNPELAASEEVAEQVGVGAVIFHDLKRERVKDVEFVLEEMLSFQGETGPYVQYTHARLCSILRKAEAAGEGGAVLEDSAGEADAGPDWSALEAAAPVLLELGRYPDVVRAAAAAAEPSVVTTYLLGLCRDVSTWYANRENQVLGQAPGVTAARLALVDAVRSVLRHGLGLLGVAAPSEM